VSWLALRPCELDPGGKSLAELTAENKEATDLAWLLLCAAAVYDAKNLIIADGALLVFALEPATELGMIVSVSNSSLYRSPPYPIHRVLSLSECFSAQDVQLNALCSAQAWL